MGILAVGEFGGVVGQGGTDGVFAGKEHVDFDVEFEDEGVLDEGFGEGFGEAGGEEGAVEGGRGRGGCGGRG